jgi:hypothetical protein
MEALGNALNFSGETTKFNKQKLIDVIKYILTNLDLFVKASDGLSSLMLMACTHLELRPLVLGI